MWVFAGIRLYGAPCTKHRVVDRRVHGWSDNAQTGERARIREFGNLYSSSSASSTSPSLGSSTRDPRSIRRCLSPFVGGRGGVNVA